MRRRDFIAGLGAAVGGAAAAWPLAARGQPQKLPVVGFLHSGSPQPAEAGGIAAAAFLQGLRDLGYAENENVAIEYRWAEERYERLAGLAGKLVERRVNVLFAGGGTNTALAAKEATSAIPVVFVIAGDPVGVGLVGSLSRPGGNVTGIANFTAELTAKHLELVHELLPGASIVALLTDPNTRAGIASQESFRTAANKIGLQAELVEAANERELASAFDDLVRRRADAVVVHNTPLFLNERDKVIALAAAHRVPALYERPEVARAGGLMSYGSSFADSNRQGGAYVGRILKGQTPADLPVMLPTKFELIINLKTAKALSIDVPATLLARATAVIE